MKQSIFFLLTLFSFQLMTATETEIKISNQADGTTLNAILAEPEDCDNCPIAILLGEETDADNTINPTAEGWDECIYPEGLEGEIKPFRDLSNYLVARGMRVLRYDSRKYTVGDQLESSLYSFEQVISDSKAVLEYATTLNVNADLHIISHNEAIKVAALQTLEFAPKTIVAISPKIARADTVFGNKVLRYWDECQNQRTVGLTIRALMLQTLDSVKNKQITEGPLSEKEGNALFNQYPLYWGTKTNLTSNTIAELNTYDGKMMVVYGSNDPTINNDDINRIENSLTFKDDDFVIKKVDGLTNALTPADDTTLDLSTMIEMANFMVGSLSIRQIASENIFDNGDSFTVANQLKATRLQIVDLAGRTIHSSAGADINKPVNSGFYILLIESDLGLVSHKFIVR